MPGVANSIVDDRYVDFLKQVGPRFSCTTNTEIWSSHERSNNLNNKESSIKNLVSPINEMNVGGSHTEPTGQCVLLRESRSELSLLGCIGWVMWRKKVGYMYNSRYDCTVNVVFYINIWKKRSQTVAKATRTERCIRFSPSSHNAEGSFVIFALRW